MVSAPPWRTTRPHSHTTSKATPKTKIVNGHMPAHVSSSAASASTSAETIRSAKSCGNAEVGVVCCGSK